jgi:hypothetical protein
VPAPRRGTRLNTTPIARPRLTALAATCVRVRPRLRSRRRQQPERRQSGGVMRHVHKYLAAAAAFDTE